MDTIAERFDINREELDELWKETQKKKFNKTKRNRRAKKNTVPSAYILFCNDERPKIKEEQPDLSFPDVARELGRRWKQANEKVKSHYKNQHDILVQEKNTDNEAPVSSHPIIHTEEEDETSTIGGEEEEEEEKPKKKRTKKAKTIEIPDDITNERERDLWEEFASLTIAQLRTQCDHNNLKKSKNRNDMIHALVIHRIALEDGNTQIDSSDDDEDN